MNKTKKFLIGVLIAAGIALCVKLGIIYYNANFNPYALGSFCSFNDLIDCDGVAKTNFSHFAGIPLFAWGLCLYLLFTVMLLAPKLKEYKFLKFLEVFKNPYSYIFVLSSVAFCVSMTLAGISIFVINKICTLCFTTYIIDLFLAILAKSKERTIIGEFKQTFDDVKEALLQKKYLITAIILSLLFVTVLAFTSFSSVFVPKVEKTSFEKLVKNKDFVHENNVVGAKNPKITVHEYFDYNCSGCMMLNMSLRRVVKELDGVMVIFHNFPLDNECNPSIKKGGHKGSCMAARYALAADKQGKYLEANEMIFDNAPVSEKQMPELLGKIQGINVKKLINDANSEEIKNQLKKEIEEALKEDINATPTMTINMTKSVGNVPYYDLKQKLINLGATEREQK